MSFSNPIGLLALLSIPAVLLLHLYRRRLQELPVSALFLFPPEAMVASAGRTRSRLLRSLSLLLELLAALFAALWIAGFQIGGGSAVQDYVLILDDSASMEAVVDDQTPRERASRLASKILDAAGREARVTVLRTGKRARVALGPRARAVLFEDWVQHWKPEAPAHDKASAFALAREIATKGSEIHYFSDRDGPWIPKEIAVHLVGKAAPNAAILGARRVKRGGRAYLQVELQGFGRQEAERTLRVFEQKGKPEEDLPRVPVAEQKLALDKEPKRLEFPLAHTDRTLYLELDDDALSIDNQRVLLPPAPRTVRYRVALTSEQARMLQLSRVFASIENTRLARPTETADLRIASRRADAHPFRTELIIDAPGKERDSWIGPFLLEHRNPILEGLALDGIVWGASRSKIPGSPLVSANAQTLISDASIGHSRRYYVNLDPLRSNLMTAPDWIIFFSNLVEEARTRRAGPGQRNLELGETILYRDAGEVENRKELQLVHESAGKFPARGLGEIEWLVERPGIYTLMRGEDAICSYSVAFRSPAVSDLTEAQSFERAAQARDPDPENGEESPALGSHFEGSLLSSILGLLVLLAVVMDWFVLGRRA